MKLKKTPLNQADTLESNCCPLRGQQQLWSKIRRHRVLREELRLKRKHLEALMAQPSSSLNLTTHCVETERQASVPYSHTERYNVAQIHVDFGFNIEITLVFIHSDLFLLWVFFVSTV